MVILPLALIMLKNVWCDDASYSRKHVDTTCSEDFISLTNLWWPYHQP